MPSIDLVDEKSQVLRVKSLPWDFNTEAESTTLSQAMQIVMLKHGGMGLAANQIGIPYRAFVMGDRSSKFWTCFNPEIVERTGNIEKESEGCLSFPNLLLDIERNSIILVRYYTAAGQLVEEELTGKWARCFQHEFDHIEGVCFDKRVSKLALGIAQRKREKTLRKRS
jgi:peptide deformylase